MLLWQLLSYCSFPGAHIAQPDSTTGLWDAVELVTNLWHAEDVHVTKRLTMPSCGCSALSGNYASCTCSWISEVMIMHLSAASHVFLNNTWQLLR